MISKLFPLPKSPACLPWDDEYKEWEKSLSENYPVSNFVRRKLPQKINLYLQIYVKDPIYWLKHFIIKRDHLLDLRKGEWRTEKCLKYTHGHLICMNKMELAILSVFREYVSRIDIDKHLEIQDNDEWIQHFEDVKYLNKFFNEDIIESRNQIDDA